MNIRKRSLLGMALGLAAATCLTPIALGAEGTVVVYSAHKQSIIDQLLPMFEAETGLKAEVIKMGSGDIARRARAEAGSPAADVIWSIAGSQLTANADLLEPYTPADFDKVDQQFVRNPNWTPYTLVVYVLAVNTDMLSADDAPRTWAELADPKWKGQIASARANASGSALQQLQTVLTLFGDEGWDEYAKISSNFVFTDSSGAVPRFVADGETSMGVTLEDNALTYVKGGAPMAILHMSDGTPATPDGVALVKNGPNPEGAKVFIDWVMSRSTQEILAKDIGRRSVRTDVAGPPGTPDLADLNVMSPLPLSEFGGVDAVLAKWQEITGQ